jgi:hypothetical protein
MANSIFSTVENLIYTPSQINWRGNPAIQAGDIVNVLDKDGAEHTVLVMSHSLKIGGGLSDTIECKGTSETSTKFSNNFESTSQKIDRVYKTLEQAIINATNAITGNSGGYVELKDTNGDGKPDEILVMDAETLENARNVWRWNKEGLGHSSNGYAGPYTLAMLANGSINADLITTGTLNADLIHIGDEKFGDYVHIENGSILLGKSGSEVKLKFENNLIAFYDSSDTRLAYFSNNSFEIENLERFRLGEYGFILRKSGNLTFTKLT